MATQKKKRELTPEQIQQIKDGFQIQRVIMKDSETQQVYWDSISENITQDIIDITLDPKIITSKAATRSIQFSTKELLQDLILVQDAYLYDKKVEHFSFKFGFVMPNTVNNWDSTIVNRPPEQMLPKEIQSGNLIVDIQMFEQDHLIFNVKVRIFYS
ncbi:unnamed protein product [Paramecium sonneborni]|uniref:GMP phosphodiesterase delta subunit domain-containing protein n=1 Tax=Paramecium sonneborni TaxID=65129 RepID=A0A8S1Q4Y1_9CILI|nr:unnamed protein product [Paramecium sonneborni]